ncbi:MAG TPA: preprotein translocase subunit SecE [Bryobacteraceae bacterium]|nr:preprotein translocase subunit SecE [Bryobacteraceae bacterium]
MAIARAQMADDENNQQSLVQRASGWPAQVRDYITELQMEMRRVTWPSWKQVRATTIVVLLSVFAFAAYFYVVDSIVASIINKILTALTH